MVRALMMVIRRNHLNFGLLLVPWAILYGVTAYLFNHSTHFSSVTQTTISTTLIPEDWPTRNWLAEDQAQIVVDQLNQRFASDSISRCVS